MDIWTLNRYLYFYLHSTREHTLSSWTLCLFPLLTTASACDTMVKSFPTAISPFVSGKDICGAACILSHWLFNMRTSMWELVKRTLQNLWDWPLGATWRSICETFVLFLSNIIWAVLTSEQNYQIYNDAFYFNKVTKLESANKVSYGYFSCLSFFFR